MSDAFGYIFAIVLLLLPLVMGTMMAIMTYMEFAEWRDKRKEGNR